MRINLILLAAGNSRRFGSNKLLYELNGKPMYRHVVDEIARLDEGLFHEKIVVSQYDEILEDLASEGWTVVRNAEPELGISRSLQLGIAADTEIDAWCFVVADQPYLKAETIEGLVQGFLSVFLKEGKTCGCVKYGDRMGNPCVFADVHRDELLALMGDVGGKKVLMRHLEECFYWEVEEERELEDVDVKKEVVNSILTEYDEERVLADLKQDSYDDGKADGIREGIRVLVESLRELQGPRDNVVETVVKKFGMPVKEATEAVDKYWE